MNYEYDQYQTIYSGMNSEDEVTNTHNQSVN